MCLELEKNKFKYISGYIVILCLENFPPRFPGDQRMYSYIGEQNETNLSVSKGNINVMNQQPTYMYPSNGD